MNRSWLRCKRIVHTRAIQRKFVRNATSHVYAGTKVDTDRVYCVDVKESMLEAASVMAMKNVGSVLVVDKETSIVKGLVTERDVSRQVGRGIKNLPLVEFMTPAGKLFTATKLSSIEEIMKMMQSHNIRHIPVLEDGVIVEMQSIKNVMKRVKELIEDDNTHLRSYLEGTY